jgi:hypothetical protein
MTSRNPSLVKLLFTVTLLAAPLGGCRAGRTPSPVRPTPPAVAVESIGSCSAAPAPPPPRRRMDVEEGCTDPSAAARLARR